MGVKAGNLPFALYQQVSEQPLANHLPLSLEQKLGELPVIEKIYTAHALPLPLTVKISEQPSANQLPFALNRKLGRLSATTIPTIPVIPPTKKRLMNNAVLEFITDINAAKPVAIDTKFYRKAWLLGNEYYTQYQPVFGVASDFRLATLYFYPLANDYRSVLTNPFSLANEIKAYYDGFYLLANDNKSTITPTVGYVACNRVNTARLVSFKNCVSQPLQPAINFAHCLNPTQAGVAIDNEHSSKVQQAIPVPCRYYPIPEPPPTPITNVCGIRPPSSRLALPLNRLRGKLPSSNLPLPLLCWHDTAPKITPNLRSYIVHNTITATLGGLTIDPMSFSFKADMSGYCWQGSIDITERDYQRIKSKLAVAKGNEPMVYVTVNGVVFGFIAEDVRRSRRFIGNSYSVAGRSSTARLGADYAHAQGRAPGKLGGGLLDHDLYASQIVAMQLADLPFAVDKFAVKDWLIPANSYSVANKTPIAVIADIAKACGGFIVSDIAQSTLSILPRWKKAAWEIATANPDVIIPLDVTREISDGKRQNPRYNTVTLTSSSDGGIVYREQQGRDKDAPVSNDPLYTDRGGIVPAGIAILSDSGVHGEYSMTLRYADKYNIDLAQLGDIWQVNDTFKDGEGAWKGVVTSVLLDVRLENEAPTVWQTVNVDRYLDV